MDNNIKSEEKQIAIIKQEDNFIAKIAKTTFVPICYQNKPENIYFAIKYGEELGLSPIRSIQSIAIINGRPCVWGDVLLAMVRKSGLLEYINEIEPNSENKNIATCKVKRKNEPELIRTFSWVDVTRAGLDKKAGAWQTYPKRMMMLRARAFALRDGFADVLNGLWAREELEELDLDNISNETAIKKLEKELTPIRKSESGNPSFDNYNPNDEEDIKEAEIVNPKDVHEMNQAEFDEALKKAYNGVEG